LTYFSKGIEKTMLKRDRKAALLESVRTGRSEPLHGMTKDEAVTMLVQDIAEAFMNGRNTNPLFRNRSLT